MEPQDGSVDYLSNSTFGVYSAMKAADPEVFYTRHANICCYRQGCVGDAGMALSRSLVECYPGKLRLLWTLALFNQRTDASSAEGCASRLDHRA